jgi:hypothetical protein
MNNTIVLLLKKDWCIMTESLTFCKLTNYKIFFKRMWQKYIFIVVVLLFDTIGDVAVI